MEWNGGEEEGKEVYQSQVFLLDTHMGGTMTGNISI